jgi:ABC-type branched-subunit amino acid transport system substrate-binding protein
MILVSASACVQKKIITGETQGVSDNEVVIGSSAALSGQASFLGTQTVHGSLAYINEVNSKGGVRGGRERLRRYRGASLYSQADKYK